MIKINRAAIKAARADKAMSQVSLAHFSGLSYQTIYSIERGDRNCSLETISAIAEVFGLSALDLVYEDNPALQNTQYGRVLAARHPAPKS